MAVAYGNFTGLDKGYDAGGAIRRFRAVVLSATTETVVEATNATTPVHGINRFDVTVGDIAKGKGASVRLEGISEVECGAAVARGAQVMSDAQGRAVTATGAGAYAFGVALEAGGAAGDLIPVRLNAGAGTPRAS